MSVEGQSVPRVVAELEGIPQIALIMGGNWDKRRGEQMVLSPESTMRVKAAGVLGNYGLIDTAIFCAGLTKGPQATPEAEAQHGLFDHEFPWLESSVKVHEERFGHTTKMDAEHTAELVDQEGLEGPFTLVTSKDYVRRQTRVFERRGFDVVPVAAEPLVAVLSTEQRLRVMSYQLSSWRLKLAASEAVLLGLDYIDPQAKITEWLAARLRPNHTDAAA